MHLRALTFIFTATIFVLCGCTASSRPTMEAVFADRPVAVDGQLDDAVWQSAPSYELTVSADYALAGKSLEQGGSVQLAWDDTHFYIALTLIDRDLIANGEGDDLHHYLLGDVGELFLKPVGPTHYWELYVTPRGHKTTFFLPGLIEPQVHPSGLRVAAKLDGTLNDPADTDRDWTAEMAMPIADLTAKGDRFGPGTSWRVFVSRYNINHKAGMKDPEFSMTPQVSEVNFHLVDQYARLKLRR